MSGNSFGTVFKVTTFGESHGPSIGAVIDGCPAGLTIDFELLKKEMQRRRPGQSTLTTSRQEEDTVTILSGVFANKTLGTPLALMIANNDQRSQDYEHLKNQYRPSHADFTYEQKYQHRDYRGGGRASARETAARVAAGAIAKMFLAQNKIAVHAYVSQIGSVTMPQLADNFDFSLAPENEVRCPDQAAAQKMIELIKSTQAQGDTLGGIISGVIRGCQPGLGEPVFDKLSADLAKAMLSIQATKGFEYGSGFAAAHMLGSNHNDAFNEAGSALTTVSNFSGGIQGGISNGMPIDFRVAFKPVATLLKDQKVGRHDCCVLPRAVAIVEAMAAIVIADHLLRNRLSKI